MARSTVTAIAALQDVQGVAALAICESLLLALYDRGILPPHDIAGVLYDAAAAHSNESSPANASSPEDDQAQMHKAVAFLINLMIDSDTSSRRRWPGARKG